MNGIKNMETATVLTLKDQVSYQPGQVVSKTLAQNNALSVTLFAFDKGEEISTHESGGDAFVTCLDGMGRITIDGVDFTLHEGESIVMPARHDVKTQKRLQSEPDCSLLLISRAGRRLFRGSGRASSIHTAALPPRAASDSRRTL